MKKNIIDKFKFTKDSLKELMLWLIGGLIIVLITEFLLRGEFKHVTYLLQNRFGVFVVNYFLVLMITSLMFVLKRKKTFYFIISFIILAIASASRYLYIIRGVPLTYSDIFSLEEGLEIAGSYINVPMIIGAVVLLAVIVTIVVLLFKSERNNKRITSYTNFILLIFVIIGFNHVLEGQKEKGEMRYIRWDIASSYRRNGYLYSTIESGLKYIRTKPEGYSKETIDKIRTIVDEREKEDKRVINKDKPNMIFVQLEAFMDLYTIKEAKFSEDPSPNYRKITEQNKGYIAKVPTTGGGTVRTEFEVMTGHNLDYLTPAEIPNNTILKGNYYNSVATTLKEQGYSAHATHNFQGNFYSRDNAYSKLGFDTFTSVEYMNGYNKNEKGWAEDTILIKYIKQALESTENRDLVYNIALQGHSPYPDDSLKKYDFPIKVEGDLSDKDKNQLYYYANQTKRVDDFIGELMDVVDNMKEKTLVVFYSDHMPSLNLFKNPDFYLDDYEAPFTFYSNFEMDNFDFDKTESYNISTLAMQLAGVEYGPMEKFHAYLGDDENYEKYEALLSYDMLFGKRYYLKEDEKPKSNKVKMGLDDIVISDVVNEKDKIIIKGKNLTAQSVVFIDNKKIETEFVNDTTLRIKKDNKGEKLIVKQLGKNDGILSQSNHINLGETVLAKK